MKKFKEIKKIKESRDMGDHLGMDKKQKMKFDQLMKKLDGGKENFELDEGYFNKELESGQYVPGMEKMYVDIIKKNGGKNIEVNKPTRREPSLSIDFDGGNIRKMEKDIENKGDGTETLDESVQEALAFSDAQLQKMKKAYSTLKRIDPSSQNYKKLKTKISKLDVDRLEQIARAKIRFVSMIAAGEYAKKSGKRLHARDYMESTELEETVQINEVQQKEVDALKKLSKDMQAVLKGYQKIVVMGDKELKDTKYNKDYEAVLKSRDTILSLIGKVNFRKAQIELKNMKESLEENVKISFHSKGAKTKWMKKQAVASKEIIKQTPTSVELPSRWKDLSKKKDHDEIFSVVVERKLTDAETDKREKVAKAIEKDSPDMPMGKKMAIATNVAKGVKMENDEYDNEGGMALSQLRTAKSAVEDLMASIKEMDNLPEWVQSKLTKAVDYMDSVRDYMASEEVELGEKYDSDKFFSGKGTPEQRLQLLKLQNKALRTLAHSPKQNAIKKEINALRKEMGMKVKKEEVELDESMARARADARRHMGGRGAQRGMAPLKKDVDNDATDGDRKRHPNISYNKLEKRQTYQMVQRLSSRVVKVK